MTKPVNAADFEEFVRTRAGMGANHRADSFPESYVYRTERLTRRAFRSFRPLGLATSAALRLRREVKRNQLVGHGALVGPEQFPRVFRIARRCSHTLQIPMPAIYLLNEPTITAETIGVGEHSIIRMHGTAPEKYSDNELAHIIGQQFGHIQNHHVAYLDTLSNLEKVAKKFWGWWWLPAYAALKNWSRKAEITADRAGLLCSQDLQASRQVLAMKALGSRKLVKAINWQAYTAQDEVVARRAGGERYLRVFARKAHTTKRLRALEVFSRSKLYQGIAHKALPTTAVKTPSSEKDQAPGDKPSDNSTQLSMAEVDALVAEIMAISLGLRPSKEPTWIAPTQSLQPSACAALPLPKG